ncbi:translation elongation factor P (EF-P) [Desulfonispora thiosulfatigenes DSM 11270]|uniref:Elongation factor P n=1 Tax=Desulfonispora thiosulfatigenes DSM 11270 TaxID=656914 RepID=A0A1W1VN33_DESTI|nr:elongation factor P [Desulfonispora thiosulfatigenes]SMB94779.1 translation elongation factor P (EF-P) [Desulfonispora thiosulfatigenes DSM 11270]
MLSTSDFKTGVTVELNGQPCQIIDFQHVKPGKGAAFVRAKIRNLRSGSTSEQTFRAGEKVPKAILDRREMQYLYNDGEFYIFMDNESFEQISLTQDQLDGGELFLKENMDCSILIYGEEVLGVDLPNTVNLEVIETEPGIKGDTASGGSKPATMETGCVVHVPFFINVGDILKIDTRTKEYVERA